MSSAYEKLTSTRDSLHGILERMIQLKREGKPNNPTFCKLLTEASVRLVDLRQINRAILREEELVRARTEATKAPADSTSLQLNNLLYEKHHYVKSIKACLDFKSAYPDIELVSVEEFFAAAPESLKNDPELNNDSHKLMLNRLMFELNQRKELNNKRKALEARKHALEESLKTRLNFLKTLPSQLKAIKKASLPLQQQLGMMQSVKKKQFKLAELLPPPLYIIYSQLISSRSTFNEAIDVEILGNSKDALALIQMNSNNDSINVDHANEDASESDESQRKRKRFKRTETNPSLSSPSPPPASQDGVYSDAMHPLSILLTVYGDDPLPSSESNKKDNAMAILRFEMLSNHQIVCVKSDNESISTFSNLFPDDTGLTFPQQALNTSDHKHLLQKLLERKYRLFKWAQHLGGVDFLPEIPPMLVKKSNEVNPLSSLPGALEDYRSQQRVRVVLHQIRLRVQSRQLLKTQLSNLSKLRVPQPSENDNSNIVHIIASHSNTNSNANGNKPYSCKLKSWNAVSRETLLLHKELRNQRSFLFPSPLESIAEASVGSGSLKKEGKSEKKEEALEDPLQSKNQGNDKLKSQSQDPVKGAASKKTESESLKRKHGDEVSWEEEGASYYRAVITSSHDHSFPSSSPSPSPSLSSSLPDPNSQTFEVEALIEVPMEYPTRPSSFFLSFLSLPTLPKPSPPPPGVLEVMDDPSPFSLNASKYSDMLRMVEQEVNLCKKGLEIQGGGGNGDDAACLLLSYQMICLMRLLDVMEWGSDYGNFTPANVLHNGDHTLNIGKWAAKGPHKVVRISD